MSLKLGLWLGCGCLGGWGYMVNYLMQEIFKKLSHYRNNETKK